MYEAKHQFPKGYKTWRILNEMRDRDGMTYGQIIKYAYEMSHGAGTFDKRNNRGYWSGAFVQAGYGAFSYSFRKQGGPMTKYAYKGDDGKYRVSGYGVDYIEEYNGKFGNLTHAGAMEMKKKSDGVEKSVGHEMASLGAQVFNQPSKVTINDPNGFFEDKTTSPEVTMRGLKLGDKVAYYSKNGNKSGVGYVFSKTEFAPGTGINPKIKVRDSLTGVVGQGLEVHYDSKNDKFLDGIKECEIIKL